jgi:hypothetical protein
LLNQFVFLRDKTSYKYEACNISTRLTVSAWLCHSTVIEGSIFKGNFRLVDLLVIKLHNLSLSEQPKHNRNAKFSYDMSLICLWCHFHIWNSEQEIPGCSKPCSAHSYCAPGGKNGPECRCRSGFSQVSSDPLVCEGESLILHFDILDDMGTRMLLERDFICMNKV